jgi:hypothetical protein
MIRSRNYALYVQSIYGNIEIIEIYCYLQPIMVRDWNYEATAIECGFTFGCPPRASPDIDVVVITSYEVWRGDERECGQEGEW